MNVACLLHVSQSICKQNTIEIGTGQNRNLHHLLKCHIKSSACSQLVRIYCVLSLGMYLYIFPSWVRTLAYIKHLFISTRFLTCAHIFSHISLWWRNMYSLLLNIYLNIPYTASISKISMNRKTKICFHLCSQPKKNLHKNDEWNIEFVTKTKKNLPNSLISAWHESDIWYAILHHRYSRHAVFSNKMFSISYALHHSGNFKAPKMVENAWLLWCQRCVCVFFYFPVHCCTRTCYIAICIDRPELAYQRV